MSTVYFSRKINVWVFFSYLPSRDNLIQLPTKADFFLLLVNPILCKKATKNQLGGNTLRFLSDFLLIYVTLCKVSYAEKKGFLSCFCILFSFAPSLGLAIFLTPPMFYAYYFQTRWRDTTH